MKIWPRSRLRGPRISNLDKNLAVEDAREADADVRHDLRQQKVPSRRRVEIRACCGL
jgi:hypothetical protein